MTICDLCGKNEPDPILKRTTSMSSPGMRGDFMSLTIDMCAKCSQYLKILGFKEIFKQVLNGQNAV